MVKHEAVLSGAAISAIILAIIQFLRAYGHSISKEQEEAWIALVNSPLLEGLALAAGYIFARMNVYSRASVEKLTGVEDPPVP